MTINLNVGILDFGAGNLFSITNAVERLIHDVVIVKTPEDFENIDCLIIPGVGSFATAMNELTSRGLTQSILDFSVKKSILGICLGFQVFASLGYEGTVSGGLNLLNANVKRFNIQLPVPHVGWNSVSIINSSDLFNDIDDNTDFYFTHSYYVDLADETNTVGETDYGIKFTSVIINQNLVGVQFHPEKSGINGLKLLENYFKHYVKN